MSKKRSQSSNKRRDRSSQSSPASGNGRSRSTSNHDRGAADDYYDPAQNFGEQGVEANQAQTNTTQEAGENVYTSTSTQVAAPTTHEEGTPYPSKPYDGPMIKSGRRGTFQGFWHLARKKTHLTEDTPARLESLVRADVFFNEGFIGKFRGLSKEKKARLREEKDRVARAIPSPDVA